MLSRCYNPNVAKYSSYGARGITVCAAWLHNYEAFQAWGLASGYSDDLTIDRIDNDKGYSPENCRWETSTVQSRNRRTTRTLTWRGKTQTPKEWAAELGISYEALQLRVSRGWDAERALAQSVRGQQ